VLWIDVPDRVARGAIERDLIGLLSNSDREAIDPASGNWLGTFASRPAIRSSHLWNVNHVTDEPTGEGLQAFVAAVMMGRQSRPWMAATGSQAPSSDSSATSRPRSGNGGAPHGGGDRQSEQTPSKEVVRVVDWNLNGATGIERKLALLADLDWDVLLLQEVTASTWEALLSLGEAGVWSRPHLPELFRPPRYHSAVVVRNGWGLTDSGPVPDVPSPERTITSVIARGAARIVVASLALPPGVAWGDAGKGRQADRIASWLAARELPTIVGIDANTPRWDRPQLEDCVWWNPQEPLLLGVDRRHDLRDAYRAVLDADPQRRAAIFTERPDGPLAVTHVRGRGANRVECRYDHVLVSPEVEVLALDHVWDDALEAGSDHALLRAVLNFDVD
jgi:endonuclease/exonuclease/phosphatase family metal-dependent hydrolase